jgi:UDP-sulfoquinovose synthase
MMDSKNRTLKESTDLDKDWSEVRSLNLNPSTLGTLSKPVVEEIRNILLQAQYPLRVYQQGREALSAIRELARKIWPMAGYELAVNQSATQMSQQLLNSLLLTIRPRVGPRVLKVLTSSHEHSGAIDGFNAHPEFEVVTIADELWNDHDRLRDLVRSVEPDIALLSWRTYDLFDRIPCEQFVEIIKDSAPLCWTLVDVAQSVGIEPIPAVGDVVFGSAHKWLMGPHGTGLMWVGSRALAELYPFNWGEAFDSESKAWGFEATGGQNFAAYAGLKIALELYRHRGVDEVWRHSSDLAENFVAEFKKIVKTPDWQIESKGPVALLHGQGEQVYELYRYLNEADCHAKCIIKPDLGLRLLRFGFPHYESSRRIKLAVEKIADYLSQGA